LNFFYGGRIIRYSHLLLEQYLLWYIFLFVFNDVRALEFPWHFLTLMKVVMMEVEEMMVMVVDCV